jgi:hypothetical protein
MQHPSSTGKRRPKPPDHAGSTRVLTGCLLFGGHDNGAVGWAMIASLLETCKLNAVDPLPWLTSVLMKLVNRWLASRIDQLMPWAYAAKPA